MSGWDEPTPIEAARNRVLGEVLRWYDARNDRATTYVELRYAEEDLMMACRDLQRAVRKRSSPTLSLP